MTWGFGNINYSDRYGDMDDEEKREYLYLMHIHRERERFRRAYLASE